MDDICKKYARENLKTAYTLFVLEYRVAQLKHDLSEIERKLDKMKEGQPSIKDAKKILAEFNQAVEKIRNYGKRE